MSMTRDELDFMRQVSDETKDDRRQAISKAGSFLTAIHRAELAHQMQTAQNPFSPTQVDKVIEAINRNANDDDADPEAEIRKALTSKELLGGNRITSARDLNGLAALMTKVVRNGLMERDQKIVAAGGPKRPGPGWTMAF